MKKSIKFLAAVVLGLAAVACSSPKKMAEMAESVVVKCNPAVLEVVAGEINAEVTVTYPEGYFHPKAILEVTPVIVYEGGEAKHEVLLTPGSRIAELVGNVKLNACTCHKYMVQQVSPRLSITGRTEDGTIEVLEYGDKVLAVQFHPEMDDKLPQLLGWLCE